MQIRCNLRGGQVANSANAEKKLENRFMKELCPAVLISLGKWLRGGKIPCIQFRMTLTQVYILDFNMLHTNFGTIRQYMLSIKN